MRSLWGDLLQRQVITFSKREKTWDGSVICAAVTSLHLVWALLKQTVYGCVPGAGQAPARRAPRFLAVSGCHSCQGSFSAGTGKGHSPPLAVRRAALPCVVVCPGDRCGTLGPLRPGLAGL